MSKSLAIFLIAISNNVCNFHFRRRCNNFQNDITDSEVYSYLLKQIAPQDKNVTMEALMVSWEIHSLRTWTHSTVSLSCLHCPPFFQLVAKRDKPCWIPMETSDLVNVPILHPNFGMYNVSSQIKIFGQIFGRYLFI